MKIVSFYKSLPISDPNSFVDVTAEQPRPELATCSLRFRRSLSNPVDAKIRSGGGPGRPDGQLPILGWDAAGVVKEKAPKSRSSRSEKRSITPVRWIAPDLMGNSSACDERISGANPRRLALLKPPRCRSRQSPLGNSCLTALASLKQQRIFAHLRSGGRSRLHRHPTGKAAY